MNDLCAGYGKWLVIVRKKGDGDAFGARVWHVKFCKGGTYHLERGYGNFSAEEREGHNWYAMITRRTGVCVE